VSVAPRLRFTGLISFEDNSLSFLGEGMDPGREVAGRDAILLRSGAWLSADDPSGVLLGAGLAKGIGAKVGDSIVLLVNRRDGGLGGLEVRVKGTFVSVTKAYDDVAVHVGLALAEELLNTKGAHSWLVYLDKTANTPVVAADLAAHLGSGVQIVPWYDMADFYNKTVRLFSRQLSVMNLLIAIVVTLAIANMMTRNVLERTSEIATSMALGSRRWQILVRFTLEGTLIGCVGALAGLCLGFAVAEIVSAIGVPMPPPPGMARGYINRISVTPVIVFDALTMASLSALVASCLPAWKASRLVIAEALRHGR